MINVKDFEGWTPEIELASDSNKNGRVTLSALVDLDNSSVEYGVVHYVKNKKKSVHFNYLDTAVNYYNNKL